MAGAINEWLVVPNSVLAQWKDWEGMPATGMWGWRSFLVNAENGAALDEASSNLWMFGGGHGDFYGNEVLSFPLASESPGWQLRCARSATDKVKAYGSTGSDWAWNLDGKPASRHTYQGTQFIRKLNRYMAYDGFTWPSATGRPVVPATLNPDSGAWDAPTTWISPTPFPYNAGPGAFAKHPVTEDIYMMPGNGYSLWKLETASKVWSLITGDIGSGAARFPATECATIDTARNSLTFLTTRGGAGANLPRCTQINLTTGARTEITINAGAAWTDFQTRDSNHAGLHYVESGDHFLYYFGGTGTGGRIWKLTPNKGTAWDLVELKMTGKVVPDGIGVARGNVLTRFRHVPRLNAVVCLVDASQPIYMARMA